MTSFTRRLLITTAGGLLLSGLAACSRSEPDSVEMQNSDGSVEVVEDVAPPVTAADTPGTPPPAASVETNAADETPPETASSPDEQMLDDASATGMTARASRGDDDAAEAPVASNNEAE